ncbi:MAG: hypothetical protein ACRDJE_15800 [Dehalococcoidia bacterium]
MTASGIRWTGWLSPDAPLYYARPIGGADVDVWREHGSSEEAVAAFLRQRIFEYHERWILADQGWSVSRFAFLPTAERPIDWYIETEIIAIDGDRWRIEDGYLDGEVHEGSRYHVDDAEELAEGLAAGAISVSDAVSALPSLGRLCEALRSNGCSGAALLAEFASQLPTPPEHR